MRKFTSLFVMSMLAGSFAYAQALDVSDPDDVDVPEAVIQAFQKDYPNVDAKDWQVLPADKLKDQDYMLELEEGDLDPAQVPDDYYTINFYGDDESATVTYDTNGKLIASDETLKDTALPDAVSKAIVEKYPDWEIEKDKETIKNLDKTFYKVKVKKGDDHKTLYLNDQGEMVDKK